LLEKISFPRISITVQIVAVNPASGASAFKYLPN